MNWLFIAVNEGADVADCTLLKSVLWVFSGLWIGTLWVGILSQEMYNTSRMIANSPFLWFSSKLWTPVKSISWSPYRKRVFYLSVPPKFSVLPLKISEPILSYVVLFLQWFPPSPIRTPFLQEVHAGLKACKPVWIGSNHFQNWITADALGKGKTQECWLDPKMMTISMCFKLIMMTLLDPMGSN